MRRRVKAQASVAEEGLALIDLLVRRYPFKSRAQWLEAAGQHQVIVNGQAGKPALTIRRDDQILYEAPEAPEPPVEINFSVLFEDHDLLALNKSGNLPCHPGGAYFENTLWFQIKKQFSLVKPHLINRLDRETSGVVLVAKTAAAAKNLSHQFFSRRVKKVYAVVVEGDFPDELDAEGWLIADAGSCVRKKRRFLSGSPNLKPCETAERAASSFALIEKCGALSLLRAEPRTGRLHQIRATLCSLGFPVVGDKLYGVDDTLFIRFINDQFSADDKVKLRLERQALHAESLHVLHPASGQPLCFFAPLPEDMQALLAGAACFSGRQFFDHT